MMATLTLDPSAPTPATPPPATPAEPPLDIAALRRGDATEFTRLVHRCAPMVAGVCRSIGLQNADADDAAAEAFAAVFRALPKFEERSQLSTWVYRIAFRQVLHVAQRRKRQPILMGDEQSLAIANESSPSAALERAEQRERL